MECMEYMEYMECNMEAETLRSSEKALSQENANRFGIQKTFIRIIVYN